MVMNQSIVRRALLIMHQREEVEYKRERRVWKLVLAVLSSDSSWPIHYDGRMLVHDGFYVSCKQMRPSDYLRVKGRGCTCNPRTIRGM
ncbi:UNVERIFIED_CONTAM: hypothetical protein Sangu_2896300 [Sesamum angustifolium]|uniref:Uncharacterized protein n=1 Tax=Sesamum angustifolium TaxID=2727405 RepID=A0AAW2IMW9_9LAMI